MKTKVMVTGASGFVGQELGSVLEDGGFEVVRAYRTHQPGLENGICNAVVGKFINATTDWTDELAEFDVVIHLAAKVHVMDDGETGDLASLGEINVEGTRNLAKQAAQIGVKRLVYLSSIKVNGERTSKDPFAANQEPRPEGAYAISKLEAEVAMREIEKETGLDVVIIRSPLVYGPGVKGNLAALVHMVKKGIPLPLAAVRNRRDLVSIYNLCDLIRICCLHPAAAGKTFLVSDGESMSTADLIRYMANGLDQKARLFFVPIWALKLAAGLFGEARKLEKLSGNLQIDISLTQRLLDWKPPFDVAESFQKMYGERKEL